MSADITAGPATGAAPSAFPRHEQTFPTLTHHEIERMRRFGELRAYKDGEALFETGKVLPDRIELSTSPLPMECSTTELRQHARY